MSTLFDPKVKKAVEGKIEPMMLEAEKWCGTRSRLYRKPEIEFAHIQRPERALWPDGRLTIRLRAVVGHDENEACTEVAHELIHCIAPAPQKAIVRCVGDTTSTVLEEGLAAYFQQHIHDVWLGVRPVFAFGESHYREAAKLVESLLREQPNAIKDLRAEQDSLRLIDSDLIMSVLHLPEGFARTLGKCLFTFEMQLGLGGR